MQFTLKLTPSVVGTSILTDETPLDGMTFLEKATDILKRNIDQKSKRHIRLLVYSTVMRLMYQEISQLNPVSLKLPAQCMFR